MTPKEVMTVIQGTYGVSRYQAVQEAVNQIRIELMAKKTDPDVSFAELRSNCHRLLGDAIDIDNRIGDRTVLKAKFRPIISKLTVAGEPRWTVPREKGSYRTLLPPPRLFPTTVAG